jgi:hypothetical protein
VKVVTKDSKLIDSSMAVKVRGKRFDIRVMEEWGGGSVIGGGCVKMGVGWQDDQTSRASLGGASNCAEAEGCFSESGTDADVSESCQVLLELQAHGGDRSATFGTNKEFGYTEGEMSGNFPNLLGNAVGPLVNPDSDIGVDTLLESEQVLEKVSCDGRSGVHGELENTQDGEDVSGDGVRTCQDVGGVEGSIGLESGCVVGNVGPNDRPKILRTRKGDLNFGKLIPQKSSGHDGVLLVNGLDIGSKAQFPESSRKAASSRKENAKSLNGNSKPKREHRKGMPTLPFNKLNKFPGFGQPLPKRKKNTKVVAGDNNNVTMEATDSDSIHNSDSDLLEQVADTNDPTGIVLEVVLPGISAPLVVSAPMAGRVVSGMDSLLISGGDEVVPDRNIVEATKLIEIAEDVGVNFHGGAGEDLAKLLVMEDRDREEKKEWEVRRGNVSDQC